MTETLFPLTLTERRFWLWEHLFSGARVANLGVRVDLQGPVDVDAYRNAFAAMALAPALRTRIVERDGEFWGQIGDPGVLDVVDAATDDDVQKAYEAVVRAPFAHGSDALLRGRLLRFSKTKSVLVVGTHHAMVDGWSFASALPRAFGAALRGQPPTFDVERWLADRRATPPPDAARVAKDAAFWAERLKDTNPLPYPTPRTPPAVASGRGVEAFVPIPRALLERVDAFASSLGARPVHVWLALVMAEVARATGSKDVLTATTSANRAVAKDADGADERSIGCTMKSNLLFARLTKETSFVDAVAAARAAVREGLAHPDFVLEDLSQLGEDAPGVSTLLNYLPVKAWDDDLDGAVTHSERVFHGGTGTRTAFSVNAADTTPQLLVHLDADVFSDAAAERMGRRLLGMLDAALADPSQAFTRLPRLVDDDRAAMVRAQGTPESRVPVTGGTLDVLFERDFDVDDAVNPRPALVHDDRVIGRRELLVRGRHLARQLVQKGVGPGRYVVFQLHDPLLVMQAVVGVVFAGGAWVPTDIASPPARFASIVEACDAALVLTDDDVRQMLAASGDAVDETIALPKPKPSDPVYAIFTSGSTGKPKGVILSHDSVVAQVQGRHGLGFPHVISYLCFAPFFFDGCIEPLLWTLTTGGTLHLLDENQRKDPALVRRLLCERKITNTSAVPTLWSAVLESDTQPLVDLKFVIVGGEALTAPLVKKHIEQAPHARFVNEYGPTESTVYSTAWDVPLDPPPSTILIGTSAPHVTCHVLDNDDQPAPAGEPGELVVSGRGVADGYLKMPEQTAKVFVRDLCVPGETAYRTGDVVRMHDDGHMEWLARKDDQVKVRGVRIELGEVEAGLAQLPGVLEVAAVVKGGRLVGYIAPAVHTESAALALLADKLPVTMIPSSIVGLPVLPKSGSDKIDKKKLPEPQTTIEELVPPRPGLETTIADIWASVLGVSPISATRSFFAYGGHSLKAAIVVARIKQATGRDVALSSLMTARTVRALAETLEPSSSTSSSPTSASSSSVDPAVRLVIPLQEAAQRSPGPVVVFLPGIGGHVFTFTAIAERLRHRAVGLRAWGAERGEVPFGTLQGMAAKNLDALAAAGITDFALAGYSMGARVAFEMAVQMHAQGKKPARLFLFDAMAPGYPKPLPLWQRARLHASTFLRADVGGKVDYVKDRAISIRNKLAFARGDAAAFVDEMPDVDPATKPLLEKLWGTAALANQAWWPATALDVSTTLFTASTPITWVGQKMDDPLLGWGDWVKRPIDNVVLGGLHLELFEEKNHAAVATAIDDALG
jgi:amino acid adenylation domain-containing protein